MVELRGTSESDSESRYNIAGFEAQKSLEAESSKVDKLTCYKEVKKRLEDLKAGPSKRARVAL